MKKDPNQVLNSVIQGMEVTRVADDPAAQLPNLATSLFHLQAMQAVSDHADEGVAKVRTVVAQQRELAKVDPDVGRPRLASALNLLGAVLKSAGRTDEALAAFQEAVEIRRELAQAKPAEYLPNLASALSNLGSLSYLLGRQDEALAAMGESVAIQRTLVDAGPEAARLQLATTLYNFGVIMSESGRWQEALPIMREGVEMQRILVETHGELMPNLALALRSLETCLVELGQHAEAAVVKREAAAVWKKVAEEMPEVLSSDIADAIGDLAERMNKSGRGGRSGKRWRWR